MGKMKKQGSLIQKSRQIISRLMSPSSSEIIWLLPEGESYWRRHFKDLASRQKGQPERKGTEVKLYISRYRESMHWLVTFLFALLFLRDNTLHPQITLNHSTVITFTCYKM
uniref:Uncharacterized protein n=1 Tax=Micrurus lemniscatus lemniscatus TaxID=129467 RepID=A0A2D4I7H3_MICLE